MATHFFWDPVEDNIVQERNDTGVITAEYATEPYLYGNLISQNRGGVESQYHFDPQGSTIALTNDNQQVTDTYAYTAFGEVTELTGSTVNPFRYVGRNGYYCDSAFGQIIVRRRLYDPAQLRWLSFDPIRAWWSVISLYQYVMNLATTLIDPSGLVCVPPYGITYIPGRGKFAATFLFQNLGDEIPINTNRLESVFEALWKADSSAFLDKECCCCDTIHFVQAKRVVVKRRRYWWNPAGAFAEWFVTDTGWTIDGGIPYPGGRRGDEFPESDNPCVADPIIQIWDAPGTIIRFPFNVGGVVESYRGEFESCVFCLKGIEGPGRSKYTWAAVIGENYSIRTEEKSLAVYGCVAWYHGFERMNNGTYVAARTISAVDAAPSNNFLEAMRSSLAFTDDPTELPPYPT